MGPIGFIPESDVISSYLCGSGHASSFVSITPWNVMEAMEMLQSVMKT